MGKHKKKRKKKRKIEDIKHRDAEALKAINMSKHHGGGFIDLKKERNKKKARKKVDKDHGGQKEDF